MKLSKILIKFVVLVLDIILKLTKVKLNIHNLENIPKDQPIFFVANHFTRIETLFLPYLLYKATGKYSVSMAHYSFFGGFFGKLIEKVGAISMRHEKRDKIFIKRLLTGKDYTIIFPEGQMVKDKKIIDNDELLIFNSGVRRPPHAGASKIALQTQFYREKMKYHYGKCEGMVNVYKEHFGLKDKEVKDLLEKETYIVPVNLTFFPLRAKRNKISEFLKKKLGGLSERFEEELMVEGTMLTEGVDIDINFGKAIKISEYFTDEMRKEVPTFMAYLKREEKIPMEFPVFLLMQDYMKGIYDNTTLNIEHIFSYILCKYGKIKEEEFKKKVYPLVVKLQKHGHINLHSSIVTHTLEPHYSKFFNDMQNVVERENGYVIYKKRKKKYRFHFIRTKNIVKVLNNEIEIFKKYLK